MNKNNLIFLLHILDAISRIEKYTTALDWKMFYDNNLIQDGVIRQLEIIGEAVKNLSIKLRDKNPDIPWQDITGMRDKLIHNYFGVDIDLVWNTIKNELPILKSGIKQILDKSDS